MVPQIDRDWETIYVFAGIATGSRIQLAQITSSATISASGHLFASTSNSDGNYNSVVVIDTASGQFYYTGSYGVGGGGGTPLTGTNHQVLFFNADNSNQPSGDAAFLFDNNNEILRIGDSEADAASGAGSHILADERELFTNARLARGKETYALLGFGKNNNITGS